MRNIRRDLGLPLTFKHVTSDGEVVYAGESATPSNPEFILGPKDANPERHSTQYKALAEASGLRILKEKVWVHPEMYTIRYHLSI